MPDVNLHKKAAKEAYEMAGVGPEDIDLIELHDCLLRRRYCTMKTWASVKMGKPAN